jgi:1-phosphatidylinositol phosphodiesterase
VHRAAIVIIAIGCSSGSQGDSDWMASLDDTRNLAELSIPGTHDSGAMFEPSPALAKCQDLTIADQLAAGIRFFDIRCRHYQDAFLIYHGSIDQNQTFDDVLATMSTFLDAHPGETVIMSIQQEASPDQDTRTFEDTFRSYVSMDPDRWYLDPPVPALGDVRGKIALLRRFDAVTPAGIDASVWPDDMTFSTDGNALRIEDEYMVAANDAKWTAITNLLDEARAATTTPLFLTFTSGYQTIDGLPNITSVSDDINARLDAMLADPAPAHLGVLVMDHVTPARAHAVIATNPASP